jgi:hypothetical protein
MKLYTIWSKKSLSHIGFEFSNQGVDEKCLMDDNEDYFGIKTGNIYSKEEFYHSDQWNAKIVAVDNENKTAMYHLEEDNRKDWKSKFIGCFVTLEKAHFADSVQVYRCLELNGEYFSEFEVEIS